MIMFVQTYIANKPHSDSDYINIPDLNLDQGLAECGFPLKSRGNSDHFLTFCNVM